MSQLYPTEAQRIRRRHKDDIARRRPERISRPSYYGDRYASRDFLMREYHHILSGLRGWAQAALNAPRPAAHHMRQIDAYATRCAELRALIAAAPKLPRKS